MKKISLKVVISVLTFFSIGKEGFAAEFSYEPEYWYYSTPLVSGAPCKTVGKLTDQELLAWTKSLAPEELLPEISVGKLKMKNEYLEWAFIYRQLMAKADDKKFSYSWFQAEDGKRTLEVNLGYTQDELIPQSTKCKSFLCALEERFGSRRAKQMAYLMHHYRMNTSQLRYDHTAKLTEEELDDIILSIGDLPKNLFPVAYEQRVTRVANGLSRQGISEDLAPSVLADVTLHDDVSFFEPWSNIESGDRQYTVIHELAHVMGTKLGNLDVSSDWKAIGFDVYPNRKEQFPTQYATTNNLEDFAESLTLFRLDPAFLKKVSPARFAFIKSKVFNGQDYLDAKACVSPEKTQSVSVRRFLALIGQELSVSSFPVASLTDSVVKNCRLDQWYSSCVTKVMRAHLASAITKVSLSNNWGNDLNPIMKRKLISQKVSQYLEERPQFLSAIRSQAQDATVKLWTSIFKGYRYIGSSFCRSFDNLSFIKIASRGLDQFVALSQSQVFEKNCSSAVELKQDDQLENLLLKTMQLSVK